jgi:predicted aspartyl protease
LPVYRLLGGVISHKFPFAYEEIDKLGEVFLPLVEVKLWFPSQKTWLDFQFIIDTGATATILPSFIAGELGFDLKTLPEIEMAGVEGTGVKSWLAKVRMMVDSREFSARCFFIDNPKVPFLLGRVDVFGEIFSLVIDSKSKEIIFKEN